jgi:hypothetical protein
MLHFRDIEADTKNIATIAVFFDDVIDSSIFPEELYKRF